MRLDVLCTESPSLLAEQWLAMLRALGLSHPDPTCSVGIALTDGPNGPSLHFRATVRDTRDAAVFRVDQAIHSVRLTIWPGQHLAALFCGVLWTGYMTHESMELVQLNGEMLLSPHAEPFHADHAFRRAAPSVLTWESLALALEVVLPRDYVATQIGAAR